MTSVSLPAGIPVHPEWYSDEFSRLLLQAGLSKIRLHDSRHTTLSLMEKAGVPISVISRWAGHYDAAFTMMTYVHASGEDLREGTRSWPSFTRSLRSCERPRLMSDAGAVSRAHECDPDLRICGALGETRTPNLQIRRYLSRFSVVRISPWTGVMSTRLYGCIA
jgi:hypothetical protein